MQVDRFGVAQHVHTHRYCCRGRCGAARQQSNKQDYVPHQVYKLSHGVMVRLVLACEQRSGLPANKNALRSRYTLSSSLQCYVHLRCCFA